MFVQKSLTIASKPIYRKVPFNITPSKEVVAEGAYSVGAVFSLDYLDPDSLQTDDLDTLETEGCTEEAVV